MLGQPIHRSVAPRSTNILRAVGAVFKPGPVVGEFQKAGLPAAIEKGKVVIKSDKVLVKSGGQITRDQAQALTKLEIYPMTVGLDLRAAYEEGLHLLSLPPAVPRSIITYWSAVLSILLFTMKPDISRSLVSVQPL